jgi:hypothetical protein
MHYRWNHTGPEGRYQLGLETHRMTRKLIALIVLFIAMIGLVYNIERTARPTPDREAAMSGESHEGHDH